MILKIDCHFHPNILLSFNKQRKIKNIRNSFTDHDLDAVLVCEHAYKNAANAYNILLEGKPNNHKTTLIPGCECLTKEGIDVIVFGKENWYSKYSSLMIPRKYTFKELVSYVDKVEELKRIITHPFLPSKTALGKHITKKKLLEYCKSNKIVEISNGSFSSISILLQSLGISKFLPDIMNKIRLIENSNLETGTCKDKIIFAGSDAHHTQDIGNHLRIYVDDNKKNKDMIFDALLSTNNRKENHQVNQKLYAEIKKRMNIINYIKLVFKKE